MKIKRKAFLFIKSSIYFLFGDFLIARNCLRVSNVLTGKPVILLIYNRVENHMAELVNQSLRKNFNKDFDYVSCGPNNDIHVPDNKHSHSRISEIAKYFRIKVFWEIESGYVSTEFQFIRKYPHIDCLKLWWVNDSHQFLDLMVKKAPFFDLTLVSMKDDVSKFQSNAFWLPGATSGKIFLDYEICRNIDVSFIGSIDLVHHLRNSYIRKLQSCFPNFKVFTNVFLNDAGRIYSASKIVFNMSLKGDLNYRVFESMACGALLVTDRINNGLLDLFEENEDLIVYDNYEDLCSKIKFYIYNEKERNRIAKNGQYKVKNFHTIENRLEFIFKNIII